jgi:seryl-tRNA synthetase
MHDIKFIREQPAAFDAALKRRPAYAGPWAPELLEMDKANRGGKTELQNLQARRNEVAKLIGEAMRTDKAKAEELKKEAADIKAKLASLEGGEEEGGALMDALARIPNLLADDVPEGADESANKEIRVVGAKPNIANPKEHFDLGEALGMMDFEAAAKMSGSRFVVLRGALARLERALAAFMLDIHTNEFGYTEHQVPYLVKDAALFGTSQLPKFEADVFQTSRQLDEDEIEGHLKILKEKVGALEILKTEVESLDKIQELARDRIKNLLSQAVQDKRYLIPTSEVPLTNTVRESILDEASLPLRLTAHTPCFRSEAGSAGRDTRGMIRQHQFSKVELVSITKPEDSAAEHERMLTCAEEVLKRLGLHYRVVLLCAGDTGFGAKKTYDLEVWLPGQNAFREISSCSNTGDFQARRMKARFRRKDAKETEFVHTLNGSGLAVGRTLVAILENYQQPDGSIRIPDALVGYMGGLKEITK